MEILPLQIMYQMVNFFVILGLLTYLLYKPILKIFADRTKRIEEGQKAAQDLIDQKAAIEELKLNTAKRLDAEENKQIQTITSQVKDKKQQLLTSAQDEVALYIKDQEQKWQEEKQRRIQTLRDDLVASIIDVTQKVIDQKLTKQDKEKLVDQQLDTVLAQLQ